MPNSQGVFTPQRQTELRDAGFSPEEINDEINESKQGLLGAGFSEAEVNDHLGVSAFDHQPMNNLVQDPTFLEALSLGFKGTGVGLLIEGKLPEEQLAPDAGMGDRLATAVGGLASDGPLMLGGALITAEGGPIIALGGAFAFPAAFRKVLMDKYEKGEVQTVREFWDRLIDATWEGTKGFITGVAAGKAGEVAGKVIPKTFKAARPVGMLSAEVTTMVGMSNALEGEIPEPHEFVDAAVLIFGAKGSVKGAQKLRDYYRDTGRKPHEMVRDIQEDMSIVEDSASVNIKLPRAFEELADVKPETLSIDGKPSTAGKKIVRGEVLEKDQKPPEDKGPNLDTPEGRVEARLSIGESQPRKKITVQKLLTALSDDLHALKNAVKEIAEGRILDPKTDPYILARLFRGVTGKAEHFLEISPFEFKDISKNKGKSFTAILKPLEKKNQLGDFRIYAVSKRAIELNQRQVQTGIDLKDAKSVVKKFEKDFKEPLQELADYQHNVATYLKDSGILSQKAFDQMVEMNKDYMPFYRLMDKEGDIGLGRGFEAFSPIKKIKGSERLIHDPLESIVKNTYMMVTLAERNRVMTSVVELAESNPAYKAWATPIKKGVKPIKISEKELRQKGVDVELQDEVISIFRPQNFRPAEDVVSVWKNGKQSFHKIDLEVAKALKNMDAESIGILMKILSFPTKTLRAGIVLDPEFALRNPVRDQFTAFVFSKNNFILGVDALRGFKTMIEGQKAGSMYADWIKSGAPQSLFTSLDRTYLQKDMARLLQQTPVRNVIKNPIEALRILSQVSEKGTRVGEFKKAIEAGKSIEQAGFESRDLFDFAKIGTKGRVINSLVAFWNATVRDADKIQEGFRTRPLETSVKIFGAITIPSILLAVAQHDDKRYQNHAQWEKDLFWVLYLNDDPDAEPWRIPKPFGPGVVFGTTFERITTMVLNSDPHAMDGLLKSYGTAILPGVVPTVAVPIVENFSNRSLFTDRPIVPVNQEGSILPEYQYTTYTTEFAKAIGKVLGALPPFKGDTRSFAAPAKIENLIRGWGGTIGLRVLKIADFSLRKIGVLPDPVKPTPKLKDTPLIRAFVARHPSAGQENIQRFYDSYFESKVAINTAKSLMKRELDLDEAWDVLEGASLASVQLQSTFEAMKNITHNINLIQANPELLAPHPEPWTDEERERISREMRQLIDSSYRQLSDMADFGNELIDALEE